VIGESLGCLFTVRLSEDAFLSSVGAVRDVVAGGLMVGIWGDVEAAFEGRLPVRTRGAWGEDVDDGTGRGVARPPRLERAGEAGREGKPLRDGARGGGEATRCS
jgi:hypothetical protein